MSDTYSTEVYVGGLIIDIDYRHYSGYKGSETEPPEEPSIDIERVYITTKDGKHINIEYNIDDMEEFKDNVIEQLEEDYESKSARDDD